MAMSSLSIVIPVLNERDNLIELAVHLAALASFADILIVDGGSSDDSQAIATSFAADNPLMNIQLLDSAPGRAAQMNCGARAASSDYVLFLHADTRLPLNFAALFQRWSESGALGDTLSHAGSSTRSSTRSSARNSTGWGFFPIRLDGGHWLFRIIERAISLRSKLTSIATGDQAICVQSSLFNRLGGYDDVPLMEDVALSKKLARVERPRCFAQPVVSSSRRWQQRGILKTVLLMWRIRLSYYFGAEPATLARLYR